MNNCFLFCGNASKELGKQIIHHGTGTILPGAVDHVQFPSGEWYCQFKENIRGADVFLLNSIAKPANDNLMQLLIMADAARRASAGRITAVIPYFGYSRQDRKDKSRVPISAKLVMDIIAASGIDRVVTMDLHSPQIAGFTNLPFDHLQFLPSLVEALKDKRIEVVVSPDVGAVKRSEEYARKMDLDLAIISKKRKNTMTVEAMHFIGDVDDKTVLIIDDLSESGGTLVEAANQCRKNGAKQIFCATTHGCFTEAGNTRLVDAFRDKVIDHLFVSNTVENKMDMKLADANNLDLKGLFLIYTDHVTYVDVAPSFAKAIKSIHNNESVSSLFV